VNIPRRNVTQRAVPQRSAHKIPLRRYRQKNWVTQRNVSAVPAVPKRTMETWTCIHMPFSD